MRLVVFLFAARVVLVALATVVLAVEIAVDGSTPASSLLRRFRTQLHGRHAPAGDSSAGADLGLSRFGVFPTGAASIQPGPALAPRRRLAPAWPGPPTTTHAAPALLQRQGDGAVDVAGVGQVVHLLRPTGHPVHGRRSRLGRGDLRVHVHAMPRCHLPRARTTLSSPPPHSRHAAIQPSGHATVDWSVMLQIDLLQSVY